jgi:hypothetical protein
MKLNFRGFSDIAYHNVASSHTNNSQVLRHGHAAAPMPYAAATAALRAAAAVSWTLRHYDIIDTPRI